MARRAKAPWMRACAVVAGAVVVAAMQAAPAWAGPWGERFTVDGNEFTSLNYLTAGFPTRLQACQEPSASEWRIAAYGYDAEPAHIQATLLGVAPMPNGGCQVQFEWPGQFVFTQTFHLYTNGGEAVSGPDQEVPWALAVPPPQCEICKGNPIYPLRGVKREVVDTGLAIGRTTLQLSYDNSAKVPKQPALAQRRAIGMQQRGGVLGSVLWFSNLHRRVSLGGDRSTAGTLPVPVPTVMERGNGIAKTMTRTGSGPLVAEPSNADRFIALAGGGYVYTDSVSNVQETYTSAGRLTAMAWSDGTRISFTYDGSGLLTQASDNRGRSLGFAYVNPGADQAPRLSTITDAGGQVTTLGYDSQGNLAGVTWPNGTAKTFRYENTNLPWALTGVSDERGIRYSSFGYDAQGRAISTEHAGGVDKYTVSYTTPPSIQVTEQAYGDSVARFYTWNLPQGTVMTEPSGQTTTWSAISLNGKNLFSAQGQQAGAGSLASSRSQSYDANGNIASRDNFNGTRSCYVNDLSRNLVTTSVAGLTTQDCATVTPANASLPAGAQKTSTQWHPDWSLPAKVAEPLKITTYIYNGQPDPSAGNATASCAPSTASLLDGKPVATLCKRLVQQTTDADGHLGFGASLQPGATATVTTWTYNEDGRVLTETTSSGTDQSLYAPETTATHTRGDLMRFTKANGEIISFDRYNKYGQLLQSTSGGVVTSYTYDLRQRMLSRTVGGQTTTYDYDAAGQLKKVTLPDGVWVGYDYDDAHRLVAAYDLKGNRVELVPDNAGNTLAQRVKDPAGDLTQSLSRVMDVLGREQQAGTTDPAPASQVSPALPTSPMPLERYEYDAQGNRTRIIRGAGTLDLVTQLRYDLLERVKETVDPKNGKTSFEHDGGDQVTQVTDPRNLTTQYPRNGLGDATQVISPDTGSESLTYDGARNLKTRTDSRGVLTTYSYDPSDQLTGATYTKSGQPGEAITLAYSQTGTGFSYGHGKLTSTSYPGGSAQYGYDAQGKLTRDLQRVDAAAGANATQIIHTVAYDYTLGRLTGITYPSRRWLSQTWVDGEITQIALGGNPLITQIEWTPFAGAPRRWRWAMASGPKVHERHFDLAGRPIRYQLGDVLRDLRYDAASRIVSFTHLRPDGTSQPALDQAFGYDENDRITGIATNAASWSISYDANGNRTGVSLNGSQSLYSTEATSNRLTGITNPARSFSYDDAGNTIVDSAGYTATYNLRGQLATITKGGVTTTYTYNAAGQRVLKVSSTGPQSTVVFVYDHEGHLLGEYDQNGVALREYVWLRDTPIAMFMPDPANPSGDPLVFYIHTDHLDAPRIVVDRDNHQRWRWLAEPFGTTAPETNPEGMGDFTQNLRFPGQVADAESGLWYNYHRHYDNSRGGYAQSDPIGLAGGINTYTYVEGNPLAFVDPSGEFAWGLAFAGADLAWQLYQNGGRLSCVNWADVGLSMLGGGLANALLKGAFRFKRGAEWYTRAGKLRDPHSWSATSSWMNKEGIQVLKDGQNRHHWLLERNQGIGANMPNWLKNQPWNTNPISAEFNSWLASRPALASMGMPSWVPELAVGTGMKIFGRSNDECGCK